MRIAMFSDSALPIINGVSLSVDSLIQELRRQGHSVDLYTAGHPKAESEPNTYRFRTVRLPWSRDYPVVVPPFYGMLREFRKHTYDVIHTHTPFTTGFVGMRWAESHTLPIVSTYHTLYDRYAHYIPLFPKRYIRFKIAKHTSFYYNHVDQVICPSVAAMRWLRRQAVRTPISIIPTACFEKQMLDRYECRRKLGMGLNERYLLYVGRLAKEKNLETLFSAAKLAFNQDSTLRLWLVGDGPYREESVEFVRKLGIGDRVKFVGFLPRHEVDSYYAAADLFVFSSITETQGLVIQEAMAYGLPAIVVVGGGAGDGVIQGENGFLVKNDPATFAQTITDVLWNESLWSKLSANASRSVQERTPEAMAIKMLTVYERAIGSKTEQFEPAEVAVESQPK